MGLRMAQEKGSGGGVYDAVVVDAYDAEGNVPEAMWKPGGGLVKALAHGLLRSRGVVAVNFLPSTDLTPRLGAYRQALMSSGAPPGLSFSVSADEGNLMAVRTCGGPSGISSEALQGLLTESARQVET